MEKKSIFYWAVNRVDNELYFESSELALEFLKQEKVNLYIPSFQFNTTRILKTTRKQREVERPIYYKEKYRKDQIRKYVKEIEEYDDVVILHDFTEYNLFGRDSFITHKQEYYRKIDFLGYFEVKTGEITSSVKEDENYITLIHSAPVYARFVTAKYVVQREVKEIGKPYQPEKKEVIVEKESDWFPIYTFPGTQYNSTKYFLMPNDGSWYENVIPYVVSSYNNARREQLEIITKL